MLEVKYIAGVNGALAIMQEVLSEEDFFIVCSVTGECTERFLTFDGCLLIDGGHHTTSAGFNAVEIDIPDFEMVHFIFLEGSAADKYDVGPEAVHRNRRFQAETRNRG